MGQKLRNFYGNNQMPYNCVHYFYISILFFERSLIIVYLTYVFNDKIAKCYIINTKSAFSHYRAHKEMNEFYVLFLYFRLVKILKSTNIHVFFIKVYISVNCNHIKDTLLRRFRLDSASERYKLR